LVAKKINIGSDKNVSKMHNTFWDSNNERQSMNFSDSQPKGIKQVLIE